MEFFDKKYLVPFGEYLPMRKHLSFFEFISGDNDYTSGVGKRSINYKDNLNFIPIICYEIIFYWKLINKYNFNNDFIINITNDVWFGNFFGPYQHLYLSKLRAAEFNKYLFRVSNNGISAIINNNGKIEISTKLNKRVSINSKLKINRYINFYLSHQFLNKFYFILFFIIIFLSLMLKNGRNESKI